jgi:predicted membrane protein
MRSRQERHRQRSTAAQMVIGFAVIFMGFAFLLDNLGWIDIDYKLQFWPVVLIVAGLLKISQSRSDRSSILGGILLFLGALFMFQGFGWFHISWRVVAPILVIGAGLLVVFKSTRKENVMDILGVNVSSEASDATLNVTAILGGFQRRVTSQDFRGGEITAMFGGCELDLRDANIQSEAVLTTFALCGGITVKVPVDWTVELEGAPILGGFDEKTAMPKDRSKRLIIRGYAIMGGVEIRN